jgi:transposase
MESMGRRKRRTFTAEYKAEVVRLVRAGGKSIGQVARELDLTDTAVRAWVRQAAIDQKHDPRGPLTSEERAELTRVRRELKTVTMERDFLRKAAAFFARSGK